MLKPIITALKAGEETYNLWSEWLDTKPTEQELHAFVGELLALQNDEEFDVNEHTERFAELWELIETVYEDWGIPDSTQHWQLRMMLYNMAVSIDTDKQSIFEILGNFAEANPNHQTAMRFYLQTANEEDWSISDLEEVLDNIQNKEFAAECCVLYAKNILNYAAQSGKFPLKTQQRIADLIKTAKQDYPILPWTAAAAIFEDNGFDAAIIADLKRVFEVL
jgi:hypothetical protein